MMEELSNHYAFVKTRRSDRDQDALYVAIIYGDKWEGFHNPDRIVSSPPMLMTRLDLAEQRGKTPYEKFMMVARPDASAGFVELDELRQSAMHRLKRTIEVWEGKSEILEGMKF